MTTDERIAFVGAVRGAVATKPGESVLLVDSHLAMAIHTAFGTWDDFRTAALAGQALVLFVVGWRNPCQHDGFHPGGADAPDVPVACVLSSGTVWRTPVVRGANGRPRGNPPSFPGRL